MHALRDSKKWILLAMVAMFTVAAAPVFAFACCCHTPTAIAAQDTEPTAAHDLSCHGSETDSSPQSQPGLTSSCECDIVGTPPVAFVQSANSSTYLTAFAPLSSSAPTILAPAETDARHFVSRGLPPPLSSFSPSVAGRAPPAT